MALVVLVLVLTLAVGQILGGRVYRLARVPLRNTPWLVAAVAVQVVATLIGGLVPEIYATGLLVSAGLAGWFVLSNLTVPGVSLAGIGLLLNAVVVVVNGAMPVSLASAERAGVSEHRLALDSDPRHVAVDSDSHLVWLGDVIPVPLPLRPEVDSPGDILVAAGVGLFVITGMFHDRRRTQAPSRVERSMTRDSDSTTRGSYS